MSDDFYTAIKDKHHDLREFTKFRGSIYLPFIEPLLLSHKENASGIDLGCGHGEWNELLRSSGFCGCAIDIDEGGSAMPRAPDVTVAEGVTTLKALPDASQTVVSAFHIADYLPFLDLQLLIREALRVLKHSGVLILEISNPQNTASANITIPWDVTEQKPISPKLLSFLTEYYGFAKVEIIRLQELKSAPGNAGAASHDVTGGTSADYAVVARKLGDAPSIEFAGSASAPDYGLREALAEKLDQALKRAARLEIERRQADDRIAIAEAQARQAIGRVEYAEGQARQARERGVSDAAMLIAMRNSTSWRITAPLRAVGGAVKALLHFPRNAKSVLRGAAKLLLSHAKRYIVRHPRLKSRVLKILGCFPRLMYRLQIATLNGSLDQAAGGTVLELSSLTPHARQIYDDLAAACASQQTERH